MVFLFAVSPQQSVDFDRSAFWFTCLQSHASLLTFIRYDVAKSPHIPWGSFAVSWQGLDFYVVQGQSWDLPLQDFWWIDVLINSRQPTTRWGYFNVHELTVTPWLLRGLIFANTTFGGVWISGKQWCQFLEHIEMFGKSHLFCQREYKRKSIGRIRPRFSFLARNSCLEDFL